MKISVADETKTAWSYLSLVIFHSGCVSDRVLWTIHIFTNQVGEFLWSWSFTKVRYYFLIPCCRSLCSSIKNIQRHQFVLYKRQIISTTQMVGFFVKICNYFALLFVVFFFYILQRPNILILLHKLIS